MLKYHIQTVELGSASPVITFSNIPQNYDDLELVVSPRFAGTRSSYGYRFNGDSSSSYSWIRLYGSGSSSISSTGAGTTGLIGECAGSGETASIFGSGKLYIPNYTSSSTKSASADDVSENNGTEAYQHIVANLWNGTSPISSISISAYGGPGTNFAVGSSASLYGIKRGADGKTEAVATGGVVTTAGGYTYHTFTSSGTFVANRLLNADVLVVGGGGGGGGNAAGGGGAGGYVAQSTSVAPSSYTVIVGSGGTRGTGNNNDATSGGASSAISFVALGGGRGAGNNTAGPASADTGGSGGGGSANNNSGGSGTSGQGNAGGNGLYVVSPQVLSGGGGGGAGAAGTSASATANTGGAGGAGSLWLNGSYYAGGGGGGRSVSGANTAASGGIGGGGAGGYDSASPNSGVDAVNGTANTGGGGGGAAWGSAENGGSGGSGVVIIRYLTPA